MEQSHHCVSQHSEGCSETVWRLPKKSVSSPVLSALSSTPTPVSPRPISPLDIRRSSPKPPPYTSLPPPLMAIPPTPPLQYALNGIPMSIPVRVPIHNSMPDAVSQAGSARQRTTDETEDEEDEGREDNGDELIYTSRNGSRAGGSAPLHEPALNNGTSRFVSTPNRHPLPPPTHTSHHPSHVSYPGLTKARTGSNTSLRRRIFAVTSNSLKGNGGDEGANGAETEGEVESDWEHDGRPICTAPGMVCAGETETETDEPSRHLPTARAPRASSRLSASFSFSQTNSFTALPWQWLLFEFSRLLAVVPASFGFIWCLWNMYTYTPDANRCSGGGRPVPDRIDYLVASLWALLTAHQCLSLTTGLLTRWRHYYAPLSTLVRLLALQGICWPATHLTVNIFEAVKRPVVAWALIGTTTCMSRSVQIWVVSNLPTNSASSQALSGGATDAREREKRRAMEAESGKPSSRGYGYIYWKKWNKWRRRRRWDWREVSIKCVLPAGVLYFVMAWAGELRRELGSC